MGAQLFNGCPHGTKEKSETTKPSTQITSGWETTGDSVPSIYHVVVCPIVADVRVTHWHEGGLINHGQPDETEQSVTGTLARREVLSDVLLPLAALVHRHIPAFVFKCGQERFLLIIQTGAGFRVVNQDVAHQLHLPLLTVVIDSAVSAPHRPRGH